MSDTGIETYYFTGSAVGQKLAQAVQTELVPKHFSCIIYCSKYFLEDLYVYQVSLYL
ncbi:hypothetical protein [Clostridium sp.]|uniref:hypothetical protein n=1 Tax=Clostridium sp. TaxID=1506 RepID=UPI003D6CEE5E